MTKYILEERGYGKYKYYGSPKPISEKKAMELKKEGKKVFNSSKEAYAHVENK